MSFQVFPPRDELSKTSSGLLEFQSIHEAVVALIQLNHRKLLGNFLLRNISDPNDYVFYSDEVETEESSSRTLKLCFSSSRQ